MKIAFLSDNYIEGHKVLDPFRAELLRQFCLRTDELLFIQTSDFLTHDGKFLDRRCEKFVFDTLRRFKPELVFSLNRAGLNPQILAEIQCPIISWYIDNPNRFPKQLREYAKNEKIYSSSKYQAQWLKSDAGGTPISVQYLPFCTNDSIFHLGKPPPAEQMVDVSFVGTLWDPTYLTHLINAIVVDDGSKEIFVQAWSRYLSDYDFDIVGHLLKNFAPFFYGSEIRPERLKNLIDDFISSQRRLSLLGLLSDLDIEVYGTRTWAGPALLTNENLFRAFHFTPIHRPEELYELYRRTRVGLSIAHFQAQSGFPIRILDIMGTGIPLVSDRHSELNELFKEGEMFLSFSSDEEGNEQIRRLLKDPELARKMGEKASAEVLRNHTFSNRVDAIFDGAPKQRLARLLLASDCLAEDFLLKDGRLSAAKFERLSPHPNKLRLATNPVNIPVKVSRLAGAAKKFFGYAFGLVRLSSQFFYFAFKLLFFTCVLRRKEAKDEVRYVWMRACSVMHFMRECLKDQIGLLESRIADQD